jgi:hypothetical protein
MGKGDDRYFDTTTIVVEGVEGVPLTIVGMGVEGLLVS